MHSTVLIDTHEVVKQLIASGFTPEQAETVCHTIQSIDLSDIATKSDVTNLGHDLRMEMAELRTELKGEMADLRTELKGEMADLRTELKGEMADLRDELKGEMAELKGEMAQLRTEMREGLLQVKYDILRYMVPVLLGQAGLIVALIKYL